MLFSLLGGEKKRTIEHVRKSSTEEVPQKVQKTTTVAAAKSTLSATLSKVRTTMPLTTTPVSSTSATTLSTPKCIIKKKPLLLSEFSPEIDMSYRDMSVIDSERHSTNSSSSSSSGTGRKKSSNELTESKGQELQKRSEVSSPRKGKDPGFSFTSTTAVRDRSTERPNSRDRDRHTNAGEGYRSEERRDDYYSSRDSHHYSDRDRNSRDVHYMDDRDSRDRGYRRDYDYHDDRDNGYRDRRGPSYQRDYDYQYSRDYGQWDHRENRQRDGRDYDPRDSRDNHRERSLEKAYYGPLQDAAQNRTDRAQDSGAADSSNDFEETPCRYCKQLRKRPKCHFSQHVDGFLVLSRKYNNDNSVTCTKDSVIVEKTSVPSTDRPRDYSKQNTHSSESLDGKIQHLIGDSENLMDIVTAVTDDVSSRDPVDALLLSVDPTPDKDISMQTTEKDEGEYALSLLLRNKMNNELDMERTKYIAKHNAHNFKNDETEKHDADKYMNKLLQGTTNSGKWGALTYRPISSSNSGSSFAIPDNQPSAIGVISSSVEPDTSNNDNTPLYSHDRTAQPTKSAMRCEMKVNTEGSVSKRIVWRDEKHEGPLCSIRRI